MRSARAAIPRLQKRFPMRTFALPVSACLLLTCPPGSAEESSLETLTVTAQRLPIPQQQSAASISVLDENTIDLVAHSHPSELLGRVPGLWVSRGNGQEHLTAIRSPVLTGAGSCGAFAVVEDGVPVRGTGFCNVNELFDINSEQAGQVEVLRGPGTVLYGSDAQHGVINVLSRAPEQDSDSLSLASGANDYRRLSVDHSRVGDNSSYRLSFNGARDGGYKDDSGFDQQKLSARVDVNLGGASVQSLLSMGNLNQETAGYVSGLDAFKQEARKRENPNPEAFRDSQSARLQSRIEWQTADGGRWLVTPYARYTEMAFLMHFLPGTPLEENGQKGLGLQSAYHFDATENFAVISGLDLERTDAWLQQSQAVGFSSFPAGKQYDYQVTAAVAAAFTQGEYLLASSSRMIAGARYERLHYEYDNRMISGDTAEDGTVCINGYTGAEGCRYTRPDDRRDTFDNLSLNAGLVHRFNPQMSAVARLARGFRAPQATELYRLQNGQVEADLDSESIDSLELGLRGEWQDLTFNLSAFYMEKADVIFQSSERLNLSNGKTRHYGLEYEFSWQCWERWSLELAGTFARHRYTSDVSEPGSSSLIASAGNDIDTAPRQIHSAILGWSPAEATRVEIQWQYMGRYYTDIENLHEYAGHQLLQLRWRQALSEGISIGVRVSNLANVDYAERADYSSLGGGDRYFIGEPRSINADIRFDF